MGSKYLTTITELNENTAHRIILSRITPGSTVLECGCASGYMTRYMKERLGAKVSIVEPEEYSDELHISAVRWTPDANELKLSGYAPDSLTDFPPHLVGLLDVDHDDEKRFGTYRDWIKDYRKVCKHHMEMPKQDYTYFRSVMLEWDNTARAKIDARVFEEFSFTSFKKWLYYAKRYALRQNRPGEDLVFINAWNEWAEGTYLEPSEPLGRTALESAREALEWR